jgi:hypothetical protein
MTTEKIVDTVLIAQAPDTPRPDFTELAAIFPYVIAAAREAEDRVRRELALVTAGGPRRIPEAVREASES